MRGWPVFLAVCLAMTGCELDSADEPSEPKPTHKAVLDTVAATELGEPLVLTAGVGTVLTDRAFVVRDVDLPENGLLVLVAAPTELQVRDLVFVEGTVRRFTFDAFKVPFGLRDPAAFQPYEDRKVLVAAKVRSLA